jgi:hypothetical protein
MNLQSHLTNSNILKKSIFYLFAILLLNSCVSDKHTAKNISFKTNEKDFKDQFKDTQQTKLSWSFKSGYIDSKLQTSQNINLDLYYADDILIEEDFIENKLQLAKEISNTEILNKTEFDSFHVKIYKGSSLVAERKETINLLKDKS